MITTKKCTLLLTAIFITVNAIGQNVKKETETTKTKMEAFVSKTGTIIKFMDTKLPQLKTNYGGAEARIRKVTNGVITAYFYQIEKEGKYSNTVASIEYSDLLELLKALKVLKAESEKDIADNPDYLETRFITGDGFEVGYYVSKGKAQWYVKLEKYGSDNTIFLEGGDIIEAAFTEAKNRIDEIKK